MALNLSRYFGVALVLGSVGCALTPGGITRDVARAGPPTAINSTLRALNEQDNQRMVLQLLNSPEMHETTRALANEIADGTLSALTEPERMARIEEMSSRYIATITRSITRSMAAGLRQDLGPAMAVVMREAIASSLHEALGAGYQRDLERVTSGLTRATVEAASRGMADGITRDLVPAIRTALTDEHTASALGTATRSLAREVVLGSNDAMAQIQRAQERGGRPSLLGRLSSLTESGLRIMQFVAIAAVALSLLLGLWVVRLIVRSRRIQAESERNAASAMMFAEAIRAAEGKPWAGELTGLLHERLKSDAVTGMIDEVLNPKSRRNGRSTSRTSIVPPSVQHAA